ncbi:pyocin knob domain-containing protein [Serratia fonticola]|uniref:pyocin knob domain-containing protein n=1 Tax=Serratia fonticola TaxID=47917 RepID=UPI003AAAC4BB
MWYKTGTINLTANNATVTGTGTAWADAKFGVMPGMILLAPDNKLYEVKQVNSNTSLTLNSNYAGSTASGQNYAIITTYEGDISQFSARFAAMLTFFQGSRNDTVSWFTGSGDMTFTKDDGTKLTVPTLAKIQADYLSKTATADQGIAGPVLFSKAATFNNGSTSLGDNVFQAKTAGANVILRYKDMDGVEQGAIYVTSATGQMTQRWGGTAFSAVYKNDGTVAFPNDIYSGSAKVATKATGIGVADLNDFKKEGDFYQHSSSNATLLKNYPALLAGTLRVLEPRASQNDRYTCNQIYYPFSISNYYFARHYAAYNDTWTAWEQYDSRSNNDARYLQIGAYGLGADYRPSLSGYSLASDYRINGAFYANLSSMTDTFGNTNTHVLNVSGYTGRTHCFQLAFPLGSDRMGFRRIQNNGVGEWKEVWHTGNTTIDANGFLKKASPIARLSSNPEKMSDEYLDGFTLSGLAAVNGEAAGVTAERVSVGVYKVTGSLGFALEGWNIEVPQDVNGNRLCFVATEAAEDGTITVKVSKRRFDIDTAAIVAGEPMDIPEGRWIDLRLEMPPVEEVQSEPEPESHEGEMASE